MAYPAPTKGFLQPSPDMAVLLAPFGCKLILPGSSLPAHAGPTSQQHCWIGLMMHIIYVPLSGKGHFYH